ncbi:enoyl-CoA hydratase/isomerase family protein [Azospirillum sp. ST 5-10]|uniref:enoyl-CoA hydratase/isomerase family protein n=1 Tax=unclassified Azospirillum TaxID=2630922 RepID=UPI003F49B6B4
MTHDAAPLIVERAGPVTRLTLNRPERGNALGPDLVEALLDAVASAAEDGTRLLVLEGRGSSFSTGFDFTGIEGQSDADLVLRFVRIETLLQAVHHAPFATLALAHGRVFGAGADLVCCCTHRVATPDAQFRMPGLRFGVVLGTRRFVARAGEAGRRILLEARAFDACKALEVGFVQEVEDRDGWPAIVERAAAAAALLDPTTAATLLGVSIADTRDADLADLVRSVQRPGLKDRMIAYRTVTARQRPPA